MNLLKYLGKPEVIKVYGEKAPKRYVSDGPFTRVEHFYPEGTERIVKKYFLFPKKIGEKKVRANQLVKQVCRHSIIPAKGDYGDIGFEHWDDIEIISQK